MKNLLIAFSGKAQAGKSETSRILCTLTEQNRVKYVIVSFAEPLKQIAREYFGWDGDKGIYYNADGSLVQDKGRQLLINIGQQFRAIRPTIWADLAIKRIKEIEKDRPEDTLFLIDDLRFENEVNVLKQFENSTIVRITRKEGSLDIDDISEKDLDNYKFEEYLENDGSLKELEEGIKKLYNKIKQ